jgi:SulP family sulfate permease
MELAKKSESGLRRWGTPLAAGATVVVCLMPVDMLYGVAVMSSLGAMAGPLAIWSAFMSMALANLFLARAAPGSALFGGVRPAQTVLVMALLLAVSSHPRLAAGGLTVALATLVLAVGTAGVFQWLIGLFRLGRVIKFIHFPVLAGIVNGSAIALGWMALKDVLALPGLAALGSVFHRPTWRPACACCCWWACWP